VKTSTPEPVLLKSPSVQFPGLSYDSVALYYVNAKYYEVEDFETLGKMVMNAQYTDGLAIIDSFGLPSNNNFNRQTLSGKEQIELQRIFYLPPNNGKIKKSNCIPFYRDAFVFYKNHHQVAQAQVSLHCNQAYFTPDTSDLADRFASDGDWVKLKELIDKIKE
jgi:hypothetical protein